MQVGEIKRVILLGLDFGSTTSSALLVSAKVVRSSATGHMQLDDVQVLYKSEPVFTPFANQDIDIEKVAKLIANWFAESGVKVAEIFSGGSMITGLAAQAHNAAALSKLITSIVGESVIATANDPCLESWLAFMGSCAALSRYHADVPIINFDIGGGTTNVALGVNGDVKATGCYFIGARHFQFVPGSYQIVTLSSYGAALLEALNITKKIGETLDAAEIAKIMAFYVSVLEAVVLGDAGFLNTQITKIHSQVAIQLSSQTKPSMTFSGGVGEVIYKIAAGETLPSTTFFGDFGIELALAIANSPILSANLKTHIPEHKGRATVVGLTLHATEISGNTIYLPNQKHLPQTNDLPLRNLPIIARLFSDSTVDQWHSAFTLAANCQQGACIQISASNTLKQTRAFAAQIRHALQASKYVPCKPLVILVDTNIGKALGNYICDWGQSQYNLIVIDEVTLRNAQFVHIGRAHQGMIPVSFYGLS